MVNNQSAGYDLPLVTWIWITVSYWVFVLQAIHDHEVKELTKRIDAQTKEDMRQLQRESKDKQAFNRYWSPPSRGVGWINCMPLLWNVSVTACVHLSIRPCICPSVRNSCECNSSYTTCGKWMKLHHNAWQNALLCMKVGIRFNMFRLNVLALVSRLLMGPFVTFCDKL